MALVISYLARVEVPAAIWRKHRIGELKANAAGLLTAEFEADYFGDTKDAPRFIVADVTAAMTSIPIARRLPTSTRSSPRC